MTRNLLHKASLNRHSNEYSIRIEATKRRTINSEPSVCYLDPETLEELDISDLDGVDLGYVLEYELRGLYADCYLPYLYANMAFLRLLSDLTGVEAMGTTVGRMGGARSVTDRFRVDIRGFDQLSKRLREAGWLVLLARDCFSEARDKLREFSNKASALLEKFTAFRAAHCLPDSPKPPTDATELMNLQSEADALQIERGLLLHLQEEAISAAHAFRGSGVSTGYRDLITEAEQAAELGNVLRSIDGARIDTDLRSRYLVEVKDSRKELRVLPLARELAALAQYYPVLRRLVAHGDDVLEVSAPGVRIVLKPVSIQINGSVETLAPYLNRELKEALNEETEITAEERRIRALRRVD